MYLAFNEYLAQNMRTVLYSTQYEVYDYSKV